MLFCSRSSRKDQVTAAVVSSVRLRCSISARVTGNALLSRLTKVMPPDECMETVPQTDWLISVCAESYSNEALLLHSAEITSKFQSACTEWLSYHWLIVLFFPFLKQHPGAGGVLWRGRQILPGVWKAQRRLVNYYASDPFLNIPVMHVSLVCSKLFVSACVGRHSSYDLCL